MSFRVIRVEGVGRDAPRHHLISSDEELPAHTEEQDLLGDFPLHLTPELDELLQAIEQLQRATADAEPGRTIDALLAHVFAKGSEHPS